MINIVSKRLENGALCCVLPKKGYNEKLAMAAFKYGSCNNEFKLGGKRIVQPYGIAHFLEHKMFADKEINIFDSFSRLSLDTNAFTNFNTTAYYFRGCENFERGLSLLFKMVGSLYVTDENIKKEKGIIEQEIKMYEDDPYWQIYFNTLSGLYKNHPCSQSVAGSVESVEQIDRAMLEQSFESFYTGENCIITVVGDVDCSAVFEQAERELKLKKSSAEKICYQREDFVPENTTEYMDVLRPIYHIGFRQNTQADVAERICAGSIIMNLLVGKSSRLRQRLVKEGLADGSLSYENVVGEDYGAYIIKGVDGDCVKIIDEIMEEVKNYRDYGISREYIKRLADMERAKMIFDTEDIYAFAAGNTDCLCKNTEMLDIYNYYDKIDVDVILKNMAEIRTDNMTLSVVKAREQEN